MGTSSYTPEQNPGIFIEMLYMLDQKFEHIQITFERAPWKRCLNQLRNNQSDAVIARHNQDRESFAQFPKRDGEIDQSLAISDAKYCLFTKRDSLLRWDGKGFTTVPDKPLAVPQGYSIVEMLQQHALPLVFTNSTLGSLDLLVKGRAEAAVTFCEAGANFLWNMNRPDLQIVAQSPPLNYKLGYLVFSKVFYQNHPQLATELWRQAAKIRRDNFSRLLDKYESIAIPGNDSSNPN